MLCTPRFGEAEDGPFWEGMWYLTNIKGAMHMEAGPSSCGRVSCSWNTAIKVCNDVSVFLLFFFLSYACGLLTAGQNHEEYWLDSWEPIVRASMAVRNKCRKDVSSYFGGQAFHKTQAWNVIVGSESC